MQGTELVVKATLCASQVEVFTFQRKIHILKTTSVLVCGQSINSYFLTLFEGGLLCVKN